MPRELIFTSVPKGVKPGSTGYCTVAKHKGIDRLLDQAVEKLCFYELMKLPSKPVVINYSILTLNTGTFYVLTRTCYSGSDHTGRTNYISHNLIFDQTEIFSQPVSPAEIFLKGTGWLSTWPQGQPPTYLVEGECKVSIPVPSGNLSNLPTWVQLTGKSSLAHELKGHPRWKFITEGGDHNKTLSLLAEFAWLDPSYLQLSWSQLTFTTYLQPSEKAANFKIVAGDLSVPAFKAISCSTLNISSTGGANACFSSTGAEQFGPLPEQNQPIVDQSREIPEAESIQPVADSPTLKFKKPKLTSVQPTFPSVTPTTGIPQRQSNLNLGQPSSSNIPIGPDDVPEIHVPRKKSKFIIFLISFISISVLGAATFAAIYFWPEKATQGTTNPEKLSQSSEEKEIESDNSIMPDRSDSGEGKPKHSEADDSPESEVIKPEPDKPEKPLEELKSEFETKEKAFVGTIENSINSMKLGKDLDNKLSELTKIIIQIENDFPEEKTIKEYKNKIDKLRDNLEKKRELLNNPLPEILPSVIDSGDPFSGFPFDRTGKPNAPDKTFFWDHNTKTYVDNKSQTAVHEAFWVKNERKNDGSGASITKFYLVRGQTYSLDEKLFENLTIPDAYEVKSESQNSVPNLKFPTGLRITDKRISKGKPNFVNYLKCLSELKVNQIFREKGNKLEFGLIHKSGEDALNERGQLINQVGEIAEMNENFSEPITPRVVKEMIQGLPDHISEVISDNQGKEGEFMKENQKLAGLLGSSFDPKEYSTDLELEISEKAVSKIKKLEKELPRDFEKAFKDKNLLLFVAGTMKFDTWKEITQTYKSYKAEEWDGKIESAKTKAEEAKDKFEGLEGNKNDKEKYEQLKNKKNETEAALKGVRKDEEKWDRNFTSEFPSESKEFNILKTTIQRSMAFFKTYSAPLSEVELESLKNYKEQIELFLNGPSYPWHVLDQRSEKPMFIIKKRE